MKIPYYVNLDIDGLSNKQTAIMDNIKSFYTIEILHIILPILQSTDTISLRIIDWFVTNYSKKNNICYYVNNPNKEIDDMFNVFLNYKLQLKAYTKKQFDPFCRRNRIKFIYSENMYLITTVGQLNFFKWAIENKVLEYIKTNLDLIESDMNDNIKNMYKSKTKKKNSSNKLTNKLSINKRKKRRELSVSANKTLNKQSYQILLNFN